MRLKACCRIFITTLMLCFSSIVFSNDFKMSQDEFYSLTNKYIMKVDKFIMNKYVLEDIDWESIYNTFIEFTESAMNYTIVQRETLNQAIYLINHIADHPHEEMYLDFLKFLFYSLRTNLSVQNYLKWDNIIASISNQNNATEEELDNTNLLVVNINRTNTLGVYLLHLLESFSREEDKNFLAVESSNVKKSEALSHIAIRFILSEDSYLSNRKKIILSRIQARALNLFSLLYYASDETKSMGWYFNSLHNNFHELLKLFYNYTHNSQFLDLVKDTNISSLSRNEIISLLSNDVTELLNARDDDNLNNIIHFTNSILYRVHNSQILPANVDRSELENQSNLCMPNLIVSDNSLERVNLLWSRHSLTENHLMDLVDHIRSTNNLGSEQEASAHNTVDTPSLEDRIAAGAVNITESINNNESVNNTESDSEILYDVVDTPSLEDRIAAGAVINNTEATNNNALNNELLETLSINTFVKVSK